MISRKIKNILKIILRKFSRYALKSDIIFQNELSQTQQIIEIEYGHLRSKETKQSIDAIGNPIPWFTYPAIEYLKQLNLQNLNCLEWGSGNSSFFFGQKTRQLISIEDNTMWYVNFKNRIKEMEILNVDIFLAKNEQEYISPPLKNKYDIIIIDGKFRKECIETAFKVFSGKGFIVLDNSNRHPDLCKIIRDNNLLQVDFIGLGPIVDFTTQTTLFFPRNSISELEIDAKLPIIGNPNNY